MGSQCYLPLNTSEHIPPQPQPDRPVLDLLTPEGWKAELSWCWQDVNVGTSATELFNEHINNLSSATRARLVQQTFGKIDEMFHDSLKPRVDSGVMRAVCTANVTVKKWGSKVTSTALLAVFY